MGKKSLFVLALCLGAWVDPLMATDCLSGLEANFQKIFWNISVKNFERELIDQILQDHQEPITRLIAEDRKGRELSQKIYAHASGELLDADYRLNIRREQNSRELSEALLKTLKQVGSFYFREDVHAFTSTRAGYSDGSFHANAKLAMWMNHYGWLAVSRESELAIEVRISAVQITVCLTADAGRDCKPFKFNETEPISDMHPPDGRHVTMPDDVALMPTPTSTEPEVKSKAHFGYSGSRL